MKKLLSVLLLITLLAALPAVLLPVRAQAQTGQENWSVLLIVSLDKKLPKGGKTNGMGYYLMTYHREGSRLSFTSFPYNLSVELPGKKGPVRKQLQFACKELGPEGAADLISQTFGIKIDYWMLINLNALVELVDLAGGVEVNLANLSINKKAGEIKYMVSKPFKKLAEAGLQRLDGVQAMAYISDTLYDNPTIAEEEARFRERHEVLIRGIIASLRGVNMGMAGLISAVFAGFGKHYMASIDPAALAGVPLVELAELPENEPQFLHIPQEIFTVKTDNGWESLGYTQEDVAAIQSFAAP